MVRKPPVFLPMENPQELRQVPVLHVQLFTILLGTAVLCQWNGEGSFPSGSSWLRLHVASHYITDYGASGLGNGEWRRMCCTCCQVRTPGVNLIHQWDSGSLAMEPMERTTEPGKIYSKLRQGVVAIIKFLPPCKLWLKFHAI